MWTEYTRESPGRRGLGVVFAAGALAGAMALAWTATRRANPVHVESLSYWPISFMVPGRFELYSLQQGEDGAEWIDGAYGQAVYRSSHADRFTSVLSIDYRLFSPSTTLEDAVAEMSPLHAEGGEPYDFGPFSGVVIKVGDPTGLSGLTIVGLSPDGLAVCLHGIAPPGDSAAARGIMDLCESIHPRAWYVPRPPWVPDRELVQ